MATSFLELVPRERERSGTIDVKIKVNYGPLGLNFEASERNVFLTFMTLFQSYTYYACRAQILEVVKERQKLEVDTLKKFDLMA